MKSQLASVDIDGERTYVMSEDVGAVMTAQPTDAVRFLPGHDQWVMGPGTQDEQVVPPAHRAVVTRRANLVIAGGVVSGTWTASDGAVDVSWFAGRGAPPRQALESQLPGLAATTGWTQKPILHIR